jgi:hypothetical protein
MANFKFQNVQKDIANATIQRNLLLNSEKLKFNDDKDITIGGIFNVNAFNKKLNKIYSDILVKERIEENITKLKAKSKIPNPNSMTLSQFTSSLISDTYDMFDEIFKIKEYSKPNINKVMNKNYRRITLYILLLFLAILIYHMLSIKSYFFSDVRNN